MSEKSQGISLRVRENLSLGKKLGKREILRVHIYFLLYFKFFCTFYGHESCCIGIMSMKLNASWCWVSEKVNPFCTYCQGSINSCTLKVTFWKHKKMAVRGEFSPFSGPNCKIVNSVGQGNFKFVRKKSGNFRNLWQTWLLSQSWASAASSSPERHNLDHHVSCRPHSKLCSCPCSPRP